MVRERYLILPHKGDFYMLDTNNGDAYISDKQLRPFREYGVALKTIDSIDFLHIEDIIALLNLDAFEMKCMCENSPCGNTKEGLLHYLEVTKKFISKNTPEYRSTKEIYDS